MKYIITQPPNIAGIGHQFHNWCLGLVVSEMLGCEYLYTPINSKIRNGKSNIKWSDFLNINKGLKKISEVKISKRVELPKIDLGHNNFKNDDEIEKVLVTWKKIVSKNKENTLFIIPYNHYIGCLSKKIHDHSTLLKNNFWENKEKKFIDEKSIGIHIRRGDIGKIKNKSRWRELNFYKKIISYLKEQYPKHKIYIFSEGKVDDFITLKEDNIYFKINENDLDSFLSLCSVDILVTGLSSFSIMASYFNNGIIYYDKLKNFTMWDNFKNYKNIKDYV